MIEETKNFNRQDFLKRFVKSGGLKFDEAAKAYEAMVSVFADAIVTGQKVTVGKVLSIKPVKRKARKVCMGFKDRSPNQTKGKMTIHLGDRIVFKVSVFKDFLNRHQITWKL